ncbi:uncharacterized protein LOC133195514 [Saccostrea echinata]|uniref:uncharacterized protein LOC133195514 n=1 Tax=Saccostrea echinata TaxID=191078 RepID=UPI002A7EAF4F|nr:uncharacterized protein LOC133195514 [Saccostrea echinata]
MHLKPFLIVLLIFIINEDASLSEKVDSDNRVHISDIGSHTFIRHREKRRILGAEHEYFRAYYYEKGLLRVYNSLRRDGLIDDWSPLGATSYSNAIATSTDYYRVQAEAGQNVDAQINRIQRILAYRRQDARNHGGGDEGHNLNIANWQNGLERIQGGQDRYECRRTYIVHDELRKRSVSYRGWSRRRVSSRRGGSRSRLPGNRGGSRRFIPNRGRSGRRLFC